MIVLEQPRTFINVTFTLEVGVNIKLKEMRRVLFAALFSSMLCVCYDADAQYQQYEHFQQYNQQYQPQQTKREKKKDKRQQNQQVQQYQQQYPPQQYQQYPPQQYQQYPQQPLTEADILRQDMMKMAEENPCQYLAMQWGDNDIRAYGVATGFDEEAARLAARMNAENELLNIMNLCAEDFARRTSIGTQLNGVNRQERVTQQDQIRFAEGDLKGVKVILIKCANVSKGVECRICVSIDAAAAANAVLNQAQAKQLIDNAEEFRIQADEAKERIRLMRTGTNAEMIKKQAEFEMEQQKKYQQHQMEMEMNQQKYQHEQQMNLQQNQYDLEKEKVKAENPNQTVVVEKSETPVQVFQIH